MREAGPRSLMWRRRAALWVLWVEALAVAFWRPLAGLAVAAALGFTGAVAALPALPHLVVLMAALAGLGMLARDGIRRLVRPGKTEADRRLEADSGLKHRPLDVLRDTPAGNPDDPLWQIHRARAAASLGRLRLRGPRPGLARRDPYALRVAAGLLLFAGLIIGGNSAGHWLGRSLFGFSLGPPSPAPVLQAWIEPPSYTGLSPIFLNADHPDVDVPDGSKLTVSLTGGYFRPSLSVSGHSEKFRVLGSASWQATRVLHNTGRLRIARLFRTVAHWTITILPNTPPAIAWASPPGQVEKSLDTRLPWKVAQRWGVAALQADMRPLHHPELPPVTVQVPLPGTPHEASGVATADLSANPYAGLDMSARLTGRDVSGQTGESDTVPFKLPARVFHDSLARAIADLRRRMALHPHDQDGAADDIEALAAAPDPHPRQTGITLNLAATAALLRTQRSEAAMAEAQDRLWITALALDGALPDAGEKALSAARDTLRRALEDRQHGKISDRDLARKIEALRQALAQRLNEIARRAQQKGQLSPPDQQVQKYSSPLLDKMMKQMEEAAKAGRMEEAKQRLAELEKMLDKLKTARVLTPEEAKQAAQAKKQDKQMMGAAQDLVKREGALMDNGQARAPRTPPTPPPFRLWGQDVHPEQDPVQAETNRKGRAADSRTESALGRALDALKQGFAASGGRVPQNLDDASRAMQDADGALQAGDETRAREAEGRAVAALQKGGQDMAKQMSKSTELAIAPGGRDQKGEDEEEGEGEDPGGQSADGKRDPLGRQVEGTGGRAADDGSVHVPTDIEQGRSRAIQEELRRRGADRERPQHELDYIDRLLKPFTE